MHDLTPKQIVAKRDRHIDDQREAKRAVAACSAMRKLRRLRIAGGLLLLLAALAGRSEGQIANDDDFTLGQAAAEQAWAGNIEEAEKIAVRIGDAYQKAGAYGNIALAQAKAGRFEEAEATMARHCGDMDVSTSSTFYRRITEAYLRAHDLSGAKASVAHVLPQDCRGRLLREIADAQAAAGDLEGAKATNAQIKSEFGNPTQCWIIWILLLAISAMAGTDGIRLHLTGRWKFTSKAVAALAIFLTVPAGFVSVIPIPFFLLLVDGALGGRGFDAMSDQYWQTPQAFYACLTFCVAAVLALVLSWLAMRYATRLRQRFGLANWLASFSVLLAGALIFNTLMLVVLALLQSMSVYESSLFPWDHLR